MNESSECFLSCLSIYNMFTSHKVNSRCCSVEDLRENYSMLNPKLGKSIYLTSR